MGTKLFSESNIATNSHNDLELENCHLNYSLDTRNSHSEENSQHKPRSYQKRQRKCKCGAVTFAVSGVICLTIGLLSIKYTFTDIILSQKLKMDPWFPFYDTWLEPDIETRLNVYIFSVENANAFLSGTDFKLKLKEIGPIVYREYQQHRDVVRHGNSTFSYSTHRRAEFLHHANKPGILNETITVPNYAVLAAAALVNEYNHFVQIAYNFLHRRYNDDGLFINITVYEYLWNYENKLIQKLRLFDSKTFADANCGILYGLYARPPERYNVKIGGKYGDSEFFQINTVNGAPVIKDNGACSEGSLYSQRLTKNNVIAYWAMCRAVDMHFAEEVEIDGILAYKFLVHPDIHDRTSSNATDYNGEVQGGLQNGLSDYSKCYYGLPFAVSQPHFCGRLEGFTEKLEGLNASEEYHSSFTIVEPKLGIPMTQTIQLQMNLATPKFSLWFEKEYQIFSDMTVPLFWMEFFQTGLKPHIILVINFFVNVLPIIEVTFTWTLCLVGISLILSASVKIFHPTWTNLKQSKQINFQFVHGRSETGSNCDVK